jgi:hypothetical protein
MDNFPSIIFGVSRGRGLTPKLLNWSVSCVLIVPRLEIQKGIEQISKALEFLHDNAGLVHGNLTPDAVFVNAKVGPKAAQVSFI